jgi:hypothetical protein
LPRTNLVAIAKDWVNLAAQSDAPQFHPIVHSLVWPKILAARVKAVSELLRASPESMTPQEITNHFSRAKPEDVSAILETLVVMGRPRKGKEKGRYLA